jgi:para-nitrobenzyl esterase
MKMRAALLCWVGGALAAAVAPAQTRVVRPEVRIDSGVVRGARVAELPRGGEFLGIPYAAQPVGKLRWRAPQPPPHWKGVREATEWGPACLQRPSTWLPEMLGVREMPTSEACLYVNVWTPEMHPAKKLPVLVWIHGGGNVEGSGEWPLGLGPTLARTEIVVVSLNYRLGALGFFAYPALDGEPGRGVSGNYGNLDQIAALEWVRRNIAAFGGDPKRVTIAGQSSGSEDVCILMASPPARGLFEGAILESGTCVDSVYPKLKEEEASGERLARDLGVTGGPDALQKLRAMPAERILETAARDGNVDLEPTIDGWMLPQQPGIAFARGQQAQVAVMVGTNEDEVSIFASPLVGGTAYRPKTVAEYHGWLEREFGSQFAGRVFAAYPARTDGEVPGVFRTMYSDYDFAFSAWLVARDTAQTGKKAYLYRFTYVGAGPFAELGAFHSEELMFLSRHPWTTWVAQPGDAALSRTLVGYWSQFVKTGNPNGAGLPAWPVFRSSENDCQELGRHVGPERVPRAAKMGIFYEYLRTRLTGLPEKP